MKEEHDVTARLKLFVRQECEAFMAEGFGKMVKILEVVAKRQPTMEQASAVMQAADLIRQYSMVYAPAMPNHPAAESANLVLTIQKTMDERPSEPRIVHQNPYGKSRNPSGRTRDPAVVARNRAIIDDHESGMDRAEILEKYGLTRGSLNMILKREKEREHDEVECL